MRRWQSNADIRWRVKTGANTILDREHRIAFMCVPKAASSSIKQAIGEWFGWDIPAEEWKEAWGREQYVQSLHRLNWDYCLPESIPPDYLALCIVRDPLERVASTFHNPGPQVVGQTDWDEYLERISIYPDEEINIHLKSNWWFERGRADVLGDVSEIDQAWKRCQQAVEEKTGKRLPGLSHRNVSGAQAVFTPAQTEMIKERYQVDYERYGDFWNESATAN